MSNIEGQATFRFDVPGSIFDISFLSGIMVAVAADDDRGKPVLTFLFPAKQSNNLNRFSLLSPVQPLPRKKSPGNVMLVLSVWVCQPSSSHRTV